MKMTLERNPKRTARRAQRKLAGRLVVVRGSSVNSLRLARSRRRVENVDLINLVFTEVEVRIVDE
jgi:class 3 adenylate cyclase